jgi:hypothetical protein
MSRQLILIYEAQQKEAGTTGSLQPVVAQITKEPPADDDSQLSARQRSEPVLRNGSAGIRQTHVRHAAQSQGEDVATVQALMRHANVSVTMNTYVQALTPAKRKAQRGILEQIREVAPDRPDPNLKCLKCLQWWAL